MSTFDLLKTDRATPEGISTSPYWVLAVVRFANQATYNRDALNEGERSYDSSDDFALEERPVLVVDSDCIQLSVSSSKDSHTTSLQAVLAPRLDYIDEILPGDWVLAWMFSSEVKAENLLSRLPPNETKACNYVEDGLKFIGRVSEISETISKSPEGHVTTDYQMSATGFTEFDSSILFFPEISNLGNGMGALEWQRRLGVIFGEIVTKKITADRNLGSLDINVL